MLEYEPPVTTQKKGNVIGRIDQIRHAKGRSMHCLHDPQMNKVSTRCISQRARLDFIPKQAGESTGADELRQLADKYMIGFFKYVLDDHVEGMKFH